ncbi:MAG: MerR family transcriptional regulator [Gemmatimonadota bacterium]|nr:MAG: MerR family transcriptional regulator [Gemmatimonadota bacterium]
MSDPTRYREPRHPIRVVSLRTGLSPDVLRVWERRYGVVTPQRSEGGQRLYSDADIERLTLLNRATQAGRAIRRVAELRDDELAALVEEDAAARASAAPAAPATAGGGDAAQDHLDAALTAVEALDSGQLQFALGQAVFSLGAIDFVDRVLAPLLRRIGDRWHDGTLTPAHEHAATVIIKRTLQWMEEILETPGSAPLMLVTTPAGERHEMGALLAGVVARTEGWRVRQLGPDLPAGATAKAAAQSGARAVAVSSVRAADSARLLVELKELRAALGDGVELLVGGAAAAPLRDRIDGIGARYLAGLGELRRHLQDLRT